MQYVKDHLYSNDSFSQMIYFVANMYFVANVI